MSDLPCNVRRQGGLSLVIGGSSLVILEGKACNPLYSLFSQVPGAVVVFIVRERESHHNSKHQQLISGVSCSVVASTSTSTTGGQGASLQDARGIRRVEKIYTVRGGGMLESVF